MWLIYAVLSAFFAALVAILAKKGVKDIDSDVATAIRTVVILITTWGIVLAKGSIASVSQISKASLWFIILSGIATGLSWLFYFKALQAGKVSQVVPVDKLSLVFTLILSVFILGEHITLKEGIGAGLVVAGIAVLALA